MFDDNTPRRNIKLSGYFSSYDTDDNKRKGYGFAPLIKNVPIPQAAIASKGTDGQITIWNPVTGVEYAFFQLKKDPKTGQYIATNGWRYHTRKGFYGRFADGKSGRGAGTPYFAGLVRAWEIEQGYIGHALAFAYQYASKEFVYLASKSDGRGQKGVDLPEGTRIQLKPSYTDVDFARWGLSRAGTIMAKALQEYGMYVIDNSGSSKVYVEDNITADWQGRIVRETLSNIPWEAFQVVNPPTSP